VNVYEPPPSTGVEVIKRYGELAARGDDAEAAARAWTESGFDDATTAKWLQARCFEPAAARSLAGLGVTPNQAALRTRDGRGAYIDTIGYKVANGDLTPRRGRSAQPVEPIIRPWSPSAAAGAGAWGAAGLVYERAASSASVRTRLARAAGSQATRTVCPEAASVTSGSRTSCSSRRLRSAAMVTRGGVVLAPDGRDDYDIGTHEALAR
jgi:hypothetical protein